MHKNTGAIKILAPLFSGKEKKTLSNEESVGSNMKLSLLGFPPKAPKLLFVFEHGCKCDFDLCADITYFVGYNFTARGNVRSEY